MPKTITQETEFEENHFVNPKKQKLYKHITPEGVIIALQIEGSLPDVTMILDMNKGKHQMGFMAQPSSADEIGALMQSSIILRRLAETKGMKQDQRRKFTAAAYTMESIIHKMAEYIAAAAPEKVYTPLPQPSIPTEEKKPKAKAVSMEKDKPTLKIIK